MPVAQCLARGHVNIWESWGSVVDDSLYLLSYSQSAKIKTPSQNILWTSQSLITVLVRENILKASLEQNPTWVQTCSHADKSCMILHDVLLSQNFLGRRYGRWLTFNKKIPDHMFSCVLYELLMLVKCMNTVVMLKILHIFVI